LLKRINFDKNNITMNYSSWVSLSVYYTNVNKLIAGPVSAVCDEIINSELANQYIFIRNENRGKNLNLLCKVSSIDDMELLKLKLATPLSSYLKQNPSETLPIKFPINDWFLPMPNNSLNFKENFIMDIMEVGGLEASLVSEFLLFNSSRLIIEIYNQLDEIEIDSLIGLAIQFHICFIFSAGMSFQEAKEFYDYYFEDLMGRVSSDNSNSDENSSKDSILIGLKAAFEQQKDGVCVFIDELKTVVSNNEKFDEEYLNSWVQVSKDSTDRIKALQLEGKFVVPEGFEFVKRLSSDLSKQERWPVYEYYLRAVTSQLGVENIYEINLIYLIKEALKTISPK